MLYVENITKTYTTGNFVQTALNSVSLRFRENEFVAILGQSGSGKTTFLNVIGGLDKYDSGDLVINGKSTKHFHARDWDAYRNNSVGFIFQSYNLIGHLTILDNVEMGMTLSGVSASQRRKKALDVLKRVGLEEHIHKKPNQLSGGQMQRVAIARALANDPDIILADEPTGALDTTTSTQIMDLIRDIARDKLVIMVTHNPELAEEYADRIVSFSDGCVIGDTAPYTDEENSTEGQPFKKTSMHFWTALKISYKNILTKKGRTFLTSLASSIGIIGIALVLSLSNGFQKQIDSYETGTLSNFPIMVSETAMNVDMSKPPMEGTEHLQEFPDTGKLYPYSIMDNTVMHTNKITQDYVDYLEKFDQDKLDGIAYSRDVSMNVLKMQNGKVTAVNTQAAKFSSFPSRDNAGDDSYLSKYYNVLAGSFTTEKNELMLIVDKYNRLDVTQLEALGLNAKAESIAFADIIGTEYKLVYNDAYYVQNGTVFTVHSDAKELESLYNAPASVSLKIAGVIRVNPDTNVAPLSGGIVYSDQLAQAFITDAQKSKIVEAQQKENFNVLTGMPFEETAQSMPSAMSGMTGGTVTQTKEQALNTLGASMVPSAIYMFPLDFDSKEALLQYMDDWNKNLDEAQQIKYTDMAEIITDLSSSIMTAITAVLVAFAAISLIVSMIMIGIIIYISVLERTKEIGVLRALGARKKDVSRVFNAETFIIGLFSGALGIGIAYLLTLPANIILKNMTDLENVAQLNPLHALILVLICLALTMLGGLIPARMAAKKDPVEALRTE